MDAWPSVCSAIAFCSSATHPLFPRVDGVTALNGPLETFCNRAQLPLQFVGVDAIGAHKGPNDGIGQYLLNRWFTVFRQHRLTMTSKFSPPGPTASSHARHREDQTSRVLRGW